jgi:hypothetical protein
MKITVSRHISVLQVAFIMLFVSYFIPDLAKSSTVVEQLLRYGSYVLFLYEGGKKSLESNQLLRFFLFEIFAIVISIFTRDFYWCIIITIILLISNQNMEWTFNTGFNVLLVSTTLVILACLIGVLPNLVTNRLNDTANRYAVGFYHSNVLPLCYMYLFLFRLVIKKFLSKKETIIWVLIGLCIYYLCKSRTSYACVLILSLMNIIAPLIHGKRILNFTRIIAQLSPVIASVFSLSITLQQGNYDVRMYAINEFFSGRYAIAYHYIRKFGIRAISFMSASEYAENQAVLDNGFLYTGIRYGLLFLLFYFFIFYKLGKLFKNNFLMLIVLIVLSIANMVDNDLYSYGFLPFLMLAFGEKASNKKT